MYWRQSNGGRSSAARLTGTSSNRGGVGLGNCCRDKQDRLKSSIITFWAFRVMVESRLGLVFVLAPRYFAASRESEVRSKKLPRHAAKREINYPTDLRLGQLFSELERGRKNRQCSRTRRKPLIHNCVWTHAARVRSCKLWRVCIHKVIHTVLFHSSASSSLVFLTTRWSITMYLFLLYSEMFVSSYFDVIL